MEKQNTFNAYIYSTSCSNSWELRWSDLVRKITEERIRVRLTTEAEGMLCTIEVRMSEIP
jgi:hypothetical protein